MTSKIREAQAREEGFTLIELLVVVIIIGILAAIAIPTFLSQRESGHQADLTSAVRNYALEIEAYATKSGGEYPTVTSNLPTGVSDPSNNTNVTYTYTRPTTTTFTLCGTHALIDGANSVTYDSANGGMQDFTETAC